MSVLKRRNHCCCWPEWFVMGPIFAVVAASFNCTFVCWCLRRWRVNWWRLNWFKSNQTSIDGYGLMTFNKLFLWYDPMLWGVGGCDYCCVVDFCGQMNRHMQISLKLIDHKSMESTTAASKHSDCALSKRYLILYVYLFQFWMVCWNWYLLHFRHDVMIVSKMYVWDYLKIWQIFLLRLR